MRRRRRSTSADSLELLLDTICNTFGGVLFIAILVVILLRMAGDSEEKQPVETLAPEDFQQMQNRLATLTGELTQLRETRGSQQRVAEKFAQQEVRDQIVARNDLQELYDKFQQDHDRQLSNNASQSRQIEVTRQENAQTHHSLEQAKQELEDLRRQLAKDRESRSQEMRSPVVRSGGLKTEIGVILRYGRLYVWHRYGSHQSRLGLNTDEFVVVNTKGSALVTQPIPTAGIPLHDDTATRAKVRERLRQFSPRTCNIAVIVRPDSFGQFSVLRDVLLEQGFEYRLMPTEEGDEIADRGGVGGKVQ